MMALVAWIVSGLWLAMQFGPMLRGYLLSDSLSFMFTAAQWHADGVWSALREHLTEGFQHGLKGWRPLMLAFFSLDYWLYESNAVGWRLMHLGLHAANAVLLATLLARLLGKGFWPGLAAAALFVSFAATVETAAWVADGGQVIAMSCALLSAHLLLSSKGQANLAWGASVVMAGLAMAAKETGVLALLFCTLVVLMQATAPRGALATVWHAIRRLWPYLGMLTAYLILRWALFGDPLLVFEHRPSSQLDVARWLTKLDALWHALAPSTNAANIDLTVRWITAAATLVAITRLLLGCVNKGYWMVMALLLVSLISLPLLPTSTTGEGGRHLYFLSAFWSMTVATLLCGTDPSRHQTTPAIPIVRMLLLTATLGGQAWLQTMLSSPWLQASQSMLQLRASLASLASTGPQQQRLVIAPDRVENAYFARNAQVAITSPPMQAMALSPPLHLTTPELVELLAQHLQLDAHTPTWCWSVTDGALKPFDLSALDNAQSLPQLRRIYRKAGCEHIAKTLRRSSLQRRYQESP